jgi:hypothetical protein
MIREEAAEARRVARWIRGYATVSISLGWLVTIGAAAAWVLDLAAFADAINTLIFIGLGAVVSGVALYGSSWSLQIAAARLSLAAAGNSEP